MALVSSSTASFQSITTMAPLDKITVSATQTSALPSSTSGIAASFGLSLQEAGLSSDSIGTCVTAQVDGYTSGGDPNYAMAGKATNRATEAQITAARTATSPNSAQGDKYSVMVSPQGKIASATMQANSTLDVFPPDLGKYYIRLDFGDYKRPSPFANTEISTNYSVVLPIPNNLQESYDLNWSTLSLGLVGDVADAITTQGQSFDMTETAKSALGTIVGNKAPEAMTAIEQGIGATPNPNVTVAFKGINLRQHNFAWTFAPTTPEESRTIQRIIKNIRQRILPKMFSGSTALLGYPSMVKPTLNPYLEDGKPLYEFKMCVIPKMAVSYSPTGIPSFFKGTNLPTFVQISLFLTEIEYFTELSDTEVGSITKAAAELTSIFDRPDVASYTGAGKQNNQETPPAKEQAP